MHGVMLWLLWLRLLLQLQLRLTCGIENHLTGSIILVSPLSVVRACACQVREL